MEEVQNSENQTQNIPQENPVAPAEVSFPTVGAPQKQSGAKTLLILGVLILVGILGFVIYKNASSKNEETILEPTPIDNTVIPSTQTVSTPEASPEATIAPIKVDKTKVKIQVQNGTGIAGEAAYLQTLLRDLGYTLVSTGNSSSQDLTATKVTFASSLDASVVTEITAKLNTIYQSVTTSTSATSTYDVVVVTGLRKGATPKASPTTTP